MNVLCVKRVPLDRRKITLTEDQQAIQTRHLGFRSARMRSAAPRRRSARRAPRRQLGGLNPRTARGEEQLRDMMAIASTARSHIVTMLGVGSTGTAAAIVAAVGAEPEPFDLILFGNESRRRRQLTRWRFRVAHALGLPSSTGVQGDRVAQTTPPSLRCEQRPRRT